MTEAVFGALVHQALLLSVGIALLWALRRPLQRRLGAGAAYAAWLLVPALLLAPVLPRPAQEPLRVVLRAAGMSATPTLSALPAPATSPAGLWLALWLAGTGFFVGLQTQRQWRLDRLGEQLPAGSSPALVGLLQPHVALPADFEQRFSAAERELILAHEQVHRDRLDNLWNLLACALTALHWWNPLAWWAARRMQADQELACDATVLAARPQARADYVRALLAAHDLTPHAAPLACRWGSVHPLVERIAMLNRPLPLNRRRALLVAAFVTGVSTLAYAAESQMPPGAGYIELQLMVERTQGTAERPLQKTTSQAKVISRDGKPSELLLKAIASEIQGWATEPLRIGLLVQKQEGGALIKTEIRSGDAGVEIGRPIVTTLWNTKARIEIDRPQAGEKFVLELTPTELPADFKPPKNTF